MQNHLVSIVQLNRSDQTWARNDSRNYSRQGRGAQVQSGGNWPWITLKTTGRGVADTTGCRSMSSHNFGSASGRYHNKKPSNKNLLKILHQQILMGYWLVYRHMPNKVIAGRQSSNWISNYTEVIRRHAVLGRLSV